DWKRKGWAYRLVFFGEKKKTSGCLTRKDLMMNKRGRVVSKARHRIGKAKFKENGLDVWASSLVAARKDLQLSGFVPVKKNRPGVGQDLYRAVAEKRRSLAEVESDVPRSG
ncbi:unnamed protein product, partial [Effrenium voratum]